MPKIVGPITPDKWEREVRRQLESQLPSDWTVICNVSWALKNEGGYVRDGQSDFVVLAPGLGMAIVEVKGSRSIRVGIDGIWYRREINRRTGAEGQEIAINEAPPEQANRNMHTLAGMVCRELSLKTFPGAYAFLVVYPNGAVEGPLDLYDPSTLVARGQMNRLTHCIKTALEARGAVRSGGDFSNGLVGKIATMFSNGRFLVKAVDTPLDAQEDVRDIDELTRHQFAALRGAFDLPSVAIIGPAGSGKTMLALWKLAALLEEGRRALYVCFNKALAECLRFQNPTLASAIVSVDRLFTQLVGPISGMTYDDHYFQDRLPQFVLDLAVDIPAAERYDSIIVDEGQDFGETRVIALLELLRKEGQWLFFADWGQDLYRTGSYEVLGAEVTFRLYHNCRNTELTNTATNKYCKQSVKAMPGVPVGVSPLLARCHPEGIMAARAWELAHDLSPDGGAVILSPFKLENSCMSGARRGYGLQITEDLEKLGKPGFVFFSTIKAFKGLEAQHVIVVHGDIPGRSAALAGEDLYVACTRATGRLAILTATEDAHAWFSRALP